MITTVNHVGSKREWKGNLDRWEKNQEFIVHWCDGGDVEVYKVSSIGRWEMIAATPVFAIELKYRKKQREPKVGEVWGNCNHVWVRAIDGSEYFDGWFRIDGQIVDTDTSTADLEFLANNIEEYYKKRLLSD